MKNRPSRKLLNLVYVLLGIFILLVAFIFTPVPKQTLFLYAALLAFVFFFGGIGLVILTLRQKRKGRVKKFLLLTGLTAAGFLVGVILHNLFYALAIISNDVFGLKYLFNVLEVGFFIFAVIACPILFMIGSIASIIKLRKKR